MGYRLGFFLRLIAFPDLFAEASFGNIDQPRTSYISIQFPDRYSVFNHWFFLSILDAREALRMLENASFIRSIRS